ncbi:N-6 DNA methylase [Sulfurimonas sp.]|uniref:HsdM family class I SAM-dependent methyltransferase n=1 Tax=Sulfurimonas sp. TaxID=2022749 RepID=UPI0025ED88D0|nr:N-6 DNA methylase [Sulfurimonas sp.]MBT5934695.1 N-6 DNA methylase [Sulfurimonas sp.]
MSGYSVICTQEEIYKYISVENSTKSYQLIDSDSFKNHIDSLLNEYKTRFPSVYEIIKNKWNTLGLEDVLYEIKHNKKGVDNMIKSLDNIENFSIENLIDLFEEINISDRYLNDFFTPKSLCISTSKMAISNGNYERKNFINIFDPTCGIGKLLFYSFLEFKEEFPHKTINLKGMDIHSRFSVFTESILDLININHNEIVTEDTLSSTTEFKDIDLVLSNPPYDKKNIELKFVDYVYKLNVKHSFIILPNNFLFSQKAEKLRKELLDNNLLESVVQMPEKLFHSTSISVSVIELKQDRKDTKVFMINASELFTKNGKYNLLNIDKLLEIYTPKFECVLNGKNITKDELYQLMDKYKFELGEILSINPDLLNDKIKLHKTLEDLENRKSINLIDSRNKIHSLIEELNKNSSLVSA